MTFIPNISGIVSTVNSTATPLGSSATFTGTAENVSQYGTVTISCFSNQSSAATGLQVQFSPDGTNWDIIRTVTYTASNKYTADIVVDAKFCRVVYTNGTNAQGSFRLQTMYHISKNSLNSAQLVSFPPTMVDTFNRLRVSNPTTIIDITYTRDINDYQESQLLSGTGAIARSTNAPMINFTVTAGTGSAIRQSRQRGIYQPGKSLLIYNTGILNANNNGTGVTTRLGYFDADNGAFFSHVGNGGAGTINVNERSSCTGSIVDTTIAQSAWNIDKMDGTGPSGLILDPSKTLIYLIDLEWLGVGFVRFGFVINNSIWYCHIIYHSNLFTLPYMQVASLPLRGEIVTTSGAGTLSKICGSVISEGGYTPAGRVFTYARPLTVPLVSVNVLHPIASFQLKNTGIFPKVNAFPTSISVLNTSNTNLVYYVVMFKDLATASVLSGSSFTSLNPSSAINYDSSTTTTLAISPFPDYTNANIIILSAIYQSASTDASVELLNTIENNPYMMTTNLAGQSSILSVIGNASGSSSVTASVTWKELY